MDECEATFLSLKEYLAKPLLLSPSVEGEDLFLYLAVSPTIVNSALIREESKIQRLMYYTSQAFQSAEDGLLANHGFKKASSILLG